MLPRAGGVLDQSSGEMLRLEKILEALAEYEQLQGRKDSARQRNEERHRKE